MSFWFEGPAAPETLSSQWMALGKEPREIFPVTFRCLVPVDGRTVSGKIEGVTASRDLMSGSPAPTISEEADLCSTARIPTARPVQTRRTTGPIEKRTARRRKAEVKVDFTQGDLHGTGITGDLSPRGMFVRSTRIPGTGPMVRLNVNLPEGRTLVLTGRVVRGSTAISSAGAPCGFGLRIAEELPDYQDLVSRLRDKTK